MWTRVASVGFFRKTISAPRTVDANSQVQDTGTTGHLSLPNKKMRNGAIYQLQAIFETAFSNAWWPRTASITNHAKPSIPTGTYNFDKSREALSLHKSAIWKGSTNYWPFL